MIPKSQQNEQGVDAFNKQPIHIIFVPATHKHGNRCGVFMCVIFFGIWSDMLCVSVASPSHHQRQLQSTSRQLRGHVLRARAHADALQQSRGAQLNLAR